MKKTICLKLCLFLLIAGLCFSCNRDKAPEEPQSDKIVLHSSPDLYELTKEWAGVFCKLNPAVEIEVLRSSEAKISENLENNTQLSFVSSSFEAEIYDRSLWKLTVGRDIIVPVINSRNPNIQEIRKQGISPAGLARILKNPGQTTWKTLIENGPDIAVNLYTTDDPALHYGIASFLETDQFTFDEKSISDSPALVASVQDDPNALGICYLMDVIDPRNKNMIEDIQILPIDRNGNGVIDYKEDVYSSMDAFIRGVWIGKYPRNLANNIYTVSSSPPANEIELDFLSWVISRGHVLLDNHGYGDLAEFERLAQVRIIDGIRDGRPVPGPYTLPKEPGFFTGPMPYILVFLLLLTILPYFIILIRSRMQTGISVQGSVIPGMALNEDQVDISPGLYYDKTHTWAFMEKDGTVKVGIDDFLQRVTGSLTRVKMKSPGERVKKGAHRYPGQSGNSTQTL
jgi:ABC-type phosphate transport system substrate-binding protein